MQYCEGKIFYNYFFVGVTYYEYEQVHAVSMKFEDILVQLSMWLGLIEVSCVLD